MKTMSIRDVDMKIIGIERYCNGTLKEKVENGIISEEQWEKEIDSWIDELNRLTALRNKMTALHFGR